MAIGEVYHHLLPTSPPLLDSLARDAFATASSLDDEFAPPKVHLAEMSLLAGEVERAVTLIEEFRGLDPDTALHRQLTLMLECVRKGSDVPDWERLAQRNSRVVLQVGKVLSRDPSSFRCAERAFSAVLAVQDLPRARRWDALLGLQSIMIAEDRDDEAILLLETAFEAGEVGVLFLYVMDALAGADTPTTKATATTKPIKWRIFSFSFAGWGIPPHHPTPARVAFGIRLNPPQQPRREPPPGVCPMRGALGRGAV